VASHPHVTAPIIGARSVEQLEPSLAAASYGMTPALRDELCALSPAPPPATDRNEEATQHNYGSR
jgi:aryl-alcohol dehydrogenase-like predicted oxidoreductase